MADDTKKILQSQLWNIANTLRSKMEAHEFRNYIRKHGNKFDQVVDKSNSGKQMLEKGKGRNSRYFKKVAVVSEVLQAINQEHGTDGILNRNPI